MLFLLRFALLICLISFGSKTRVYGQEQQEIPEAFLILSVPEGNRLESIYISPDGNWAIARVDRWTSEMIDNTPYTSYVSSSLQVWNLQAWTGDVNEESVASYEFDLDLALDAEGSVNGGTFSLAPDLSKVAIRIEQDVWLLSFPNLEILEVIPDFSGINWYFDGNLLADFRRDSSQIQVYDIQSGNFASQDLPEVNGSFQPVETGWLIDNRSGAEDIAFAHCTVLLEHCQNYYLADSLLPPVLSPDNGYTILVSQQDSNRRNDLVNVLWTWDSEISGYIQTGSFPNQPASCPRRFSQDGQYLFADCGDYIWHFASQTASETIETLNPQWVANTHYLLDIQAPPDNPSLNLYDGEGAGLLDSRAFVDWPGLNWSQRIADYAEASQGVAPELAELSIAAEAPVMVINAEFVVFVIRMD